MEDIDIFSNINNINDESSNKSNNQQNEDSYSILDNIENELQFINKTFIESLKNIETFSPFISKGKETNMEKTEKNDFKSLPNYEQERNNFDNMINTYSDKMNEHFNKIFDLTNKLKKFDEFNTKEEDLKKKLEQLKQKNINSNTTMENKLKSIEKIYNELNTDNSMMKEINRREQIDDDMEYL